MQYVKGINEVFANNSLRNPLLDSKYIKAYFAKHNGK